MNRVPVRFSGEPDSIGKYIEAPSTDGVPRIKYYNYRRALEIMAGFDGIMEILEYMKPTGKYKYNLVDVKPQYLKAGEHPCMPFWHCDIVDNPLHDSVHERHTMYVAGLDCPTKFIMGNEISIPETGFAYDKLTTAQCEQSEQWYAPDSTIFTVSRMHIHCCQPAKETGWRLLVRVTETNNYRSLK